MKTANKIIAAVLWLAGLVMLAAKVESIEGMLFIVPFAFGPHIVTHACIYKAKGTRSQAVLFAALLTYFAWFSFVYVSAFYTNVDPQSPVAMLFVGIYAVPVMAVLWFLAYGLDA